MNTRDYQVLAAAIAAERHDAVVHGPGSAVSLVER